MGCFHILAVRYNFVWTFVFTFLHESVFQSLGWIPGVELLVHMFTPWLTFGELPDYFPKLLHHLKFPPQCMRAPTSPCPCWQFLLSNFLVLASLVMRWSNNSLWLVFVYSAWHLCKFNQRTHVLKKKIWPLFSFSCYILFLYNV